MPEVTTCPDCDKKLKVPDALLGKKVKCPGCGEMFLAKADAAEDETEQEEAPARAKPRKDAVTARKGSPARPRDEEEDERPRAKSRRDEEEDERPRAKSRRDEDEDERPRAKSRRDEEEDERPRAKSRRDEDEDDRERDRGGRGVKRAEDLDDRPSRRSRDDEDRGRSRYDDEDDRVRSRLDDEDDDHRRGGRRPSRADQAKGWRGVSTGVYLMTIGNWLLMASIGLFFITGGVGALGAGGMVTAALNGGLNDARNAFDGAMVIGVIVFGLLCIIGLLYCGYFVLHMVGEGLWLQVPAARGGSGTLRVMAIIAFSCDGAAFLCRVLAQGAASAGTNIGGLFSLLALALDLGGFVCRCLFLMFAAKEVGDEQLGGKFLFYMISWFVFYALLGTAFTITLCGGFAGMASSAKNQNVGGAAASFGVMFIVIAFLYVLMFLVYAGLTGWFVLLLTRLRGAIARHVSKL